MFKANVIGLDAFKKQIDSASKELKAEVDAELQASAMEYVGLAKKDLASQGGDRGTLLRSISYKKEGDLSYTVSANTFYAPFIEFGTKSKFNPYPGTEEFASQYRGATQSGSLKLIDAIKAWVKRKGIASGKEADRAAFLIARSIYKNGISPKPFFFKQIPIVRNNLTQRLNALLNGL
jgi:HK97 gp10 family phage protein